MAVANRTCSVCVLKCRVPSEGLPCTGGGLLCLLWPGCGTRVRQSPAEGGETAPSGDPPSVLGGRSSRNVGRGRQKSESV